MKNPYEVSGSFSFDAALRKTTYNYYDFMDKEVLAYCNHLGYPTIGAAHASVLGELLSWEHWPDKQVLLHSGEPQLVIYKPEIVVDEKKSICDSTSVTYTINYRRLYEI